MLVIQSGDSIRLIALPADGGKPAQLQSLETHIPEILQLAVYPPLGLLQTEGVAKRKLLAALGVNGEIEWWDLSETVSARHELPNLFSAFRDSLQVIRLDSNQIHSSLDWSPGGIALLTTMAETSEEFGLAAVFAIDGKDGWRPLLHRHEEKYGSSTSRSQGSLGAVTGYNVKNAGDLGVKSATWLGDEGALTLGFDGTLHAREIAHLEANRFWLVATQVSCFGFSPQYLLAGGQDGKLRFIDIENIGDDDARPPLTLNGHDAPIRVLQAASDRILSVDAAGVERIWSLSNPILTPDDTRAVVTNWKWLLRRSKGSSLEVWPLAPENLSAPNSQLPLGNPKQTAINPDGSWAATLNIEPSNSLPLVVRLWQVDPGTSTQTPKVERRYPAIMPDLSNLVELQIAVSSGEARVILSGTDYAKNRSVVWTGDLFKPEKSLRELKEGDFQLRLRGATPDLHWAVVQLTKPGAKEKSSELADLRHWNQAPTFLPLENFEAERIGQASPDGQWLCLEPPQGGISLIVDLSAATRKAPPVQWTERAYCWGLIFGRKRPPMILDGGNLHVWNASGRSGTHLQKVLQNPGLKALAWDDSGEWLALGHRDGRVWLTRPPGATAGELRRHIESSMALSALPPPQEPEARGEIWRVFPFPGLGWIVASTDKHNILIWHQSADRMWHDPPTIISNRELYLDGELSQVQFRPDGRMALFNGQLVNFDPPGLIAEGGRLLSGRLGWTMH
jgi:hypothetical protein